VRENAPSGRITAIEAQRRQRGRVNVYIHDQFAFSVSEAVATRFALRPGLVLAAADVATLAKDDDFQVALDSALRFLAFRQRSEREVRQNLARKGIADALIEPVIVRLKELRLIDDAAFAQFWVENRDRFNPRGARALRSELFGKGVAREMVDDAIAEGDDEELRAHAVAAKKATRLQGLDYHSFCRRIIETLVRRGFSYDIASRVARALYQGSAAEDNDA
jgi:regulatory protein